MSREIVGLEGERQQEHLAPAELKTALARVAWMAALIGMVGLGDFALAWFPLGVAGGGWLFAKVSSSFAALPIMSIGFGGAGLAVIARGGHTVFRRALMAVNGVLALLVIGLMVAAVVNGLQGIAEVTGPARAGVWKAMVRNVIFGAAAAAVLGGVAFGLRRQAAE